MRNELQTLNNNAQMEGCVESQAKQFATESSSPPPWHQVELTDDNDQDNGAYHPQNYHHLQEGEKE